MVVPAKLARCLLSPAGPPDASWLDVLTSAFTFPSPEPVQNPIRTMRLLERNNAGEISLTKYLVGDNIP